MSEIELMEIGNLDDAIHNCQELAKCLEGTINYVRRLNIKYNSCAWLDADYEDYLNSLLHTLKADVHTPTKRQSFHGSSNRLSRGSPYTPSPRKNHSLIAGAGAMSPLIISSPTVKLHRNIRGIILSSSDINHKFLKIKRNIESLLYNVENTIKVSNKRNIYMANLRSRINVDVQNAERKRHCRCH